MAPHDKPGKPQRKVSKDSFEDLGDTPTSSPEPGRAHTSNLDKSKGAEAPNPQPEEDSSAGPCPGLSRMFKQGRKWLGDLFTGRKTASTGLSASVETKDAESNEKEKE